jgi:hypothetical protein
LIRVVLNQATGGQEGSAGDLPPPGERSGDGNCKPKLAGNCNRGRCYGSFARRPEQHRSRTWGYLPFYLRGWTIFHIETGPFVGRGYVSSPPYRLARNIFQCQSLQLNKQGSIEVMEASMNSVRGNTVPLYIRREYSNVLGWSKRLDERFPVHLQGPS